MAKQKQVTIDLIQQKEDRLARLAQNAEATMSLVRSQIDGLNRINGEIRQEIGEIDEFITRLTRTRDGLTAESDRNEKVAGNFAKLLCIE